MPRRQAGPKMCQKCKQRKPARNFLVLLAPGPSVEVSRFCETCRTTLRTCRRCEQSRPITDYALNRGGRHGMCKSCYTEARRAFYQRGRERNAATWRERFGTDVPPGASWHDQDPDEVLEAPRRRRAERLRAATAEPIDREAIFDRDDWICGLCGEPVRRDEATLDHVVPLSLGGQHDPTNLRLAHGSCNSRRGDGVAGSPPISRGDPG